MTTNEIQNLLRSLGLPDDGVEGLSTGEPSVPVNVNQLHAFFDDSLGSVEHLEVAFLISHEKAWHDASMKVLVERGKVAEANSKGLSLMVLYNLMRTHQRKLMIAALAAMLIIVPSIIWLSDSGNQFLDGSNRIALRGNKIEGLEDYDASRQQQAFDALSDGKLPVSSENTKLRVGLLRARGEPSKAIKSPYLTGVMSDRPVFQWREIEGNISYEVVVQKLNDDKTALTSEKLTETTSWQPQEPLQRGQVYKWSVIYEFENENRQAPTRSEPQALFLVLDEDSFKRVSELEQTLAGSPLLLFLMYTEELLYDKAEAELDNLRQQNVKSEFVTKIESAFKRQRSELFVEKDEE